MNIPIPFEKQYPRAGRVLMQIANKKHPVVSGLIIQEEQGIIFIHKKTGKPFRFK